MALRARSEQAAALWAAKRNNDQRFHITSSFGSYEYPVA
jgi:hypothetical protein